MPFKTQAELRALDDVQLGQLYKTMFQAGLHPHTEDAFLVLLHDCYAGMHILGGPGYGKTSFMENQIMQHILAGLSVIALDPHGDMTDHIIAQLPYWLVDKVYIIDIADTQFFIGLNLLDVDTSDPLAVTQAVDRIMHALEVIWPDIMSQLYLPLTVRMATIALLANHGSTLVDKYRFLDDVNYRRLCVDQVQDQAVKQYWRNFESLPRQEQIQQLQPLKNRLASLIIGRPIVRNMIGQPKTTLNLRQAIEEKMVILIKLPLKTLPQDAKVIGTLLVAAIHEAVFSYSLVPEAQRPGVSLFVDEFQNFASQDFAELITEGRKFGVRVAVANQFLAQLLPFLQQAVKNTRTKVCFRLIPDDAMPMASFFVSGQSRVRSEDIITNVVDYLTAHGSEDWNTQQFIEWYLLPLLSQKRQGQVEILNPGTSLEVNVAALLHVPATTENPRVPDPTPYLNRLLYEVMRTGRTDFELVPEILFGFSNCGHGFFKYLRWHRKGSLLGSDWRCPEHYLGVVNGQIVWRQPPIDQKDQLDHFLYHLRVMMAHLSQHPLGKATHQPISDVAQGLTELPEGVIWIRSGDDIGVCYTDHTLLPCDPDEYEARWTQIKVQTIQKYCVGRARAPIVTDQPTQPLQPTKPQFRRYTEVL